MQGEGGLEVGERVGERVGRGPHGLKRAQLRSALSGGEARVRCKAPAKNTRGRVEEAWGVCVRVER